MKSYNIKGLKLLYVAPRYHTNQVPIMRGLWQSGCQVLFLAQHEWIGEVHDGVDFQLMKKSWISKCMFRWIDKKCAPNQVEGKKMRMLIPAFFHTKRVIKEFQPDLVILRERYLASVVIYWICRMLRIKKTIMYVQQPIYDGDNKNGRIKQFLKNFLFPKVAFSPVYYHGKKRDKLQKSTVHFVPLVVEGKSSGEVMNRSYCQDGIIRFLDVGKYQDYKNHFFLIDAFSKIKKRGLLDKVQLTIVGQMANRDEKAYYESLKRYIVQKELENIIELRENIPFGEMEQLYMDHDVLLLSSTYESAGMVILEAMENGLCVATSIFCGLGSYLDEYHCGYTFHLDGTKELEEILASLIQNRDEVRKMGQKSREVVQEHFRFENYLEELNKLTEKEYNYTIFRE